MSRRTPPRPLDVEALFPEVAPLRREAVRLHPRAGRPTCHESSVGGPLLWPAAEPWPACEDHPGSPLVPVVQVFRADVPAVVPFSDGCDLLQLLWCPRRHDGRWVVPLLRWRSSAAVGAVRPTPPPPVDAVGGRVPRPCVVHPEQVTEYPSWDLPQELFDSLMPRMEQIHHERGWEYQDHLSTAPGIKLGGYPGWCRDPQWPVCRGCRTPMQHLLTIESGEEHDSDHIWTPYEDGTSHIEGPRLRLGDYGGVYLFECHTCPDRPFTDRFDA
ncbi:DUF1963 domain-containing protein [Kitasatospora sp. NPDC002227]|uniref:DUF1963 domain-containing protein n=1 Tax=Kitasatospora sp. NPDC002227 TaxID=3154773 RepID=UPI00332A85BB